VIFDKDFAILLCLAKTVKNNANFSVANMVFYADFSPEKKSCLCKPHADWLSEEVK